MNISEAVRFSFQSLQANRLRTFLTALGLIIGNASVILVVTSSLVGTDLILDQIRGLGSNLITASYESGGQNATQVEADYVKLADVQAIRDLLGSQITAATAVMPSTGRIVVNGKERDVTVIGTDEFYPQVRKLVILAGRVFDANDISLRERVAVVTEKLAIRLYGSSQNAIGQVIRLHQIQFTIVGAFREKTSTFGTGEVQDETVMVPLTMAKYFSPIERVDPMWVQTRYADDVPRITQEVQRLLESRHRAGAKYNVMNLKGILDTAAMIGHVLTLLLIATSALALLISGIGIMNIMLVTVTERTREIGLRKAVGASRREILSQFLIESVVLSVGGGFLGILIGVAIPLSVTLLTSFSISVSPWSVVAAFVVSISVGIGFGMLPASKAASLNPTEALRYE